MADLISGIETELSKGYQRIDIVDNDSVHSSIVPPEPNLIQNVPYLPPQMAPQMPSVVPPSQVFVPMSNELPVVPSKANGRMFRAKRAIRNVVNMSIIVLVLLLIALIIYLTFVRYYLAGANFMAGNKMVSAALLSPELSTGLSTLALAL
jgi:hypothetical protein